MKREDYVALGIGEYWRFDPSGGEFIVHDVPLAGDTLVDGEYIPVEIVLAIPKCVIATSGTDNRDKHVVE